MLVGRDAERRAVSRFEASLPAGPCALFFTGPAGVGKTATWQYGVDRLGSVAHVLECRPTEFAHRLSYLALADLLDDVTDVIVTLEDTHRSAIAHLVGSGAASRAADPIGVGLAVAEVFRRMLNRPLVLAIDDAQWLDGGSARVLGFVIRRLSRAPIGVLATQRGDGLPQFMRTLPVDRIDVCQMGPLSVEEVDTIVQRNFGVAFRRETLQSLYSTSGGNPLYAVELARAALRPQAARTQLPAGDLPASLRDLLGSRVAALGGGALDALVVVAAAAEPTVELVTTVVGSGGAAGLQRAMDAGLLQQERGRLRFVHPLLAAVAWAAADALRARRLQLALARLAVDPEERGRLLARAVQLPDADIAQAVEIAAEAAARRGAPDSAAFLAERAAELTPPGTSQDWAQRLRAAADYCWDAGDHHRSFAHLRTLSTALPPGAARADVLRRMAVRTAMTQSFAAARPLLAEAVAEAAGDAAVHAAACRDLAFAQLQEGDVAAAGPLAAEAVALAERAGDADSIADAEAVALLHRVIAQPGSDPEQLAQQLTALSQRGDTTDRTQPTGSRLVLTGALLKWIDRFDESRVVLTRAWRFRWDRQEDGLLFSPLFQLSELECWAGRYDEVDRLDGIAESTERRIPDRETPKAMRLYTSALVAARRGSLAVAASLANTALEIATATADGRNQLRALAVLGYIALASGACDEAVARLNQVDVLSAGFGYAHPGVVRHAGDLIEALITSGALAQAGQRLDLLARQADQARSPWGLATAERCRGLLLLARDDKPHAVDVLTDALARSRAQPDPLETVRTLVALGQAMRRDRRRARAREVLHQAVDLSGALGAAGWSTTAAAELGRCGEAGISGRSNSPAGSPATSALTPMQSTIADLVVSGRSNRQIAAQLFISAKTVESHLSAIYRQLGVHNRTELAASVHQTTKEGNSPMPPDSTSRTVSADKGD